MSSSSSSDLAASDLLPSINPTATDPLHFFLRVFSDQTRVIHAHPGDTVRSIHAKIESITGIPLAVQCLIYGGKQLKWEQTLSECGVENNADLHLIGRMQSTSHPRSWQLTSEIIHLVRRLHREKTLSLSFFYAGSNRTLSSMLMDFLNMTHRTDSDRASGHFQVFIDSSVSSSLISLYISSNKPNRDVAHSGIRMFISSCKAALPRHAHTHFVPIVLELCRLLRSSVGSNDSMYCLCRNTLGSFVESMEFVENESPVEIHDIFPFLMELAAKVSADVARCVQLDSFLMSMMGHVHDFSSFAGPVKKWIKRRFCDPIPAPNPEDIRNLPRCSGDEVFNLRIIFLDLMFKTVEGMTKIEVHLNRAKTNGDIDGVTNVGGQFLTLLKELNSISKCYQGCEEYFWRCMKQKQSALCCMITMSAKRGSDHSWISERKDATNFEARRHLSLLLLPKVDNDYYNLHEMLIDRANLLPESFEYIINAKLDSLRAGLYMEFKNEVATGPGVLREWFLLVCQTIFNPQNPLFVSCPNDRRRFFPNPASKVDNLDSKYFNFVGKVIALALMHKVQVGIVFDRTFFMQLCGHTVTLEDIKDADPIVYSSCKQILEMDPELVDQDTLGLVFAHEIDVLGKKVLVELFPDGKNVAVNSENRRQYVDSLIQHRFVKETVKQVEHFATGFGDILSGKKLHTSFFQCLNAYDFELMLRGREDDISVDDWKDHTKYSGFKVTDVQISWFWKIVGSLTREQKMVLLFFWTSIKYLPMEGFRGLSTHLCIVKNRETSDHLPSSHTCFYQLCFPAYLTMAEMRNRFSVITQEHVSCSFGTW